MYIHIFSTYLTFRKVVIYVGIYLYYKKCLSCHYIVRCIILTYLVGKAFIMYSSSVFQVFVSDILCYEASFPKKSISMDTPLLPVYLFICYTSKCKYKYRTSPMLLYIMILQSINNIKLRTINHIYHYYTFSKL